MRIPDQIDHNYYGRSSNDDSGYDPDDDLEHGQCGVCYSFDNICPDCDDCMCGTGCQCDRSKGGGE